MLKRKQCAPLKSVKEMRLAVLTVLVSGLLIVGGCKESQSTFVSNCVANSGSKAQCSCAYDIAIDALTDDHFELYSADVAGDRQRLSKAMATIGMIGGAFAASRILWVETNVETACRGL